VTLGNLVGGAVFTGFAIYLTYRPKRTVEPIATIQVAAE
jgi:formate/nitrite transporter FocA (FNT family)